MGLVWMPNVEQDYALAFFLYPELIKYSRLVHVSHYCAKVSLRYSEREIYMLVMNRTPKYSGWSSYLQFWESHIHNNFGFYEVCLFYMAAHVRRWGFKLPIRNGFQMATKIPSETLLRCKLINHISVSKAREACLSRIICRLDLVGTWWCVGGSFPISIAAPLSVATEFWFAPLIKVIFECSSNRIVQDVWTLYFFGYNRR